MSRQQDGSARNGPGPHPGPSDKVVCFLAAGQRFAIPIRQVKETVAMRHVTRVFLTPEFVVGVTNLRGEIVAVLDLVRLLGLGRQDPETDSKIIISRAQGKIWGLLVAEMEGVRGYAGEDLQDASTAVGQHPEWVLGLLPGEHGPAVVLDMERLLDFGPVRALMAPDEKVSKST